jgi:hypothetical protein
LWFLKTDFFRCVLNYTEILEKYLYRIARDELSDISSVVPLLEKASVYVLGACNEDPSDNSVRIHIPVRNKSNYNLVPVFLDKTRNFQPQPHGEYDFLEIQGDALLKSIPSDYGLIIEPMTSLEVIFPPSMLHSAEIPATERHIHEESDTILDAGSVKRGSEVVEESYTDESGASVSSKVRYLRASDFRQHSEADEKDESESVSEMNFRLFDSHPGSDFYDADSPDESTSPETSQDDERIWIRPSGKKNLEGIREDTESKTSISYDIEERFLQVVRKFEHIQEAYSVPYATAHSEWVMGVLADPWSSDERFELIESIAKISQEFYGYAGAVEVYDDLNDTHSKSWELFKMISPFYSRDLESPYTPLSSSIEREHSRQHEEKSGIRESVNKITKSGFRLFGR